MKYVVFLRLHKIDILMHSTSLPENVMIHFNLACLAGGFILEAILNHLKFSPSYWLPKMFPEE